MSHIRKRRDAYQAEVCRKGAPRQVRTFRTLADAKAWSRKVESEIDRGLFIDDLEARTTTIADSLLRNEREVLPSKRSIATVKSQIRVLTRLIGDSTLSKVTPNLLNVRVINAREVSEQSLRKDLSLLQRIFNTAIKDWGIALPYGNPVCQIRMPEIPQGRERRLEDGEEEAAGSRKEILSSSTPNRGIFANYL